MDARFLLLRSYTRMWTRIRKLTASLPPSLAAAVAAFFSSSSLLAAGGGEEGEKGLSEEEAAEMRGMMEVCGSMCVCDLC